MTPKELAEKLIKLAAAASPKACQCSDGYECIACNTLNTFAGTHSAEIAEGYLSQQAEIEKLRAALRLIREKAIFRSPEPGVHRYEIGTTTLNGALAALGESGKD